MSDQIDVNQLSNALQQKVDLPSGKSQADIDYVVEWQIPTSENNYTWYRLYKSGWVEQGGFNNAGNTYQGAVINLVKTMANSNYSITLAVNNGESYTYPTTVRYSNRTTTSFNATGTYNGGYGSYEFTWEVKGFAAQS